MAHLAQFFIKDWYGDVLFTAPAVASQVAKPLLRTMLEELRCDGRKFTFLCGHESNIGSVLAALDAEDYSLPKTIEKKTPIGCKLVIEKWENAEGQLFAGVADDVHHDVVGIISGVVLRRGESHAMALLVEGRDECLLVGADALLGHSTSHQWHIAWIDDICDSPVGTVAADT